MHIWRACNRTNPLKNERNRPWRVRTVIVVIVYLSNACVLEGACFSPYRLRGAHSLDIRDKRPRPSHEPHRAAPLKF